MYDEQRSNVVGSRYDGASSAAEIEELVNEILRALRGIDEGEECVGIASVIFFLYTSTPCVCALTLIIIASRSSHHAQAFRTTGLRKRLVAWTRSTATLSQRGHYRYIAPCAHLSVGTQPQ